VKHGSAASEPTFFGLGAWFRGENMSTFPDEVLTRTKKGEVEVRSLIDRGRTFGTTTSTRRPARRWREER